MSESLNAGLTDSGFSGRSECDQTHHLATLTAHIVAAGLQGIPRRPEGLPPQTSPPQVLLHHMLMNKAGVVPRQNHIGWLSGAQCPCYAPSRHRKLHIHMHLLLLLQLLCQHLLQCILSIITAGLLHQGKDLCMMAMRNLTLLQSRCLTRCTTMVRPPTCTISMCSTLSLSMFCAPVRLSMHSVPHTRWPLISFRKPSRLSMQSVLLTSRQGTGCTLALLHLLCRVTQVQLSLICNAALTSQMHPDFPVGTLAARSGTRKTHSFSGLYVAEAQGTTHDEGVTCIKQSSSAKGVSIACTGCWLGVLPVKV